MNFINTRDAQVQSAAGAIIQGISKAGGLFVPERFAQISPETLRAFSAMRYHDVAREVISPYLTGLEDKTAAMVESAYGSAFDSKDVAPLVRVHGGLFMLELFHGPTLAFKDMALQLLPHLMTASAQKLGVSGEILILVATSGDTGKAAMEGFRDVPKTRIVVLYPDGGVSSAQRLQMVTQEGTNVGVLAVKGNFDDAQSAVKSIFTDQEFAKELGKKDIILSSANSINLGRLLPQIAYYFWAYSRLCAGGEITPGDKINFCVPTGNFGNILAAYYAARMGLPVNKLICASNKNNVLSEFFNAGTYQSKRQFYKTMSCSIDILISSNLERLLFEMDNRGSAAQMLMRELAKTGAYSIPESMRERLSEYFYADFCTEEQTLETVKTTFNADGYLMDPHTAVAKKVYDRYRERTGDTTRTVITATASPFKFASDILNAFESAPDDPFECARRLSTLTGKQVPPSITGLSEKAQRHTDVCEIAGIRQWIMNRL